MSDLIGETDLSVLKRIAVRARHDSESALKTGQPANALAKSADAMVLDLAIAEIAQLRRRVAQLDHENQVNLDTLLAAVIAVGGIIDIERTHDIACEGAELTSRYMMGRCNRLEARPKKKMVA